MKAFICDAVEHGLTTLLTPLFTPPLDTEIGKERMTVQLIDVEKTENGYHFDFNRLGWFMQVALDCGVKYFEMSHLFTQWGAKCVPKIVATVNGEEKKNFGWETEALSGEYSSFLKAFLPALRAWLIENGKLNLDHCANGVELAIIGTSLSVKLSSTVDNSYMRVYVDNDKEGERIKIAKGTNTYTVAENLTNGYHKIRLVKATEMLHSSWDVLSFDSEMFATLPEKSDLKIEFIGDSITAGNANLGSLGDAWSVDNSDSAKTYAYFTAQELNANYSIVAMSGICVKAYHWVKNINMSTLYTYTSNINQQAYDYSFNPDVIVLNLGTNDANYMTKPEGSNYSSQFPNDYRAYLSFLREKNPDAYIICLYGMMGKNLSVDANIQAIVDSSNDAKLVYNPFEFEKNTLGGADHPSLSAQQTWGEALAEYIKGLNV